MKNTLIYSFLLLFVLVSDCFAESGIYVGGHIRRERPGTITTLKESGFTYVILFNVNVESDGTLTTDGETICKDGQYVFGNTQPYYISDVKSLKVAPTSINRIEICIGGWGNTSYNKIKSLVASQGTGSTSMLYKNFKALKDAIPEIDAVNNDDESAYDVNSAVSFHVMMKDLGYKTALAPYMNKSYWQDLATKINTSRPGAVDRILIQCYDGGINNNPSDWHINNIPLHAGRLNYQDFNESKTVMQDWKNNKGVVGGFFWVYNDNTWNLNAYATATNRIFGAKTTTSPVATFYSDITYGGYSVSLPLGSFTTADMAAYGLTNNDLTSLKINSGYKVIVYTENNFTGTSATYTTDQSYIGSIYNDKISSIKVERVSTAEVATFYTDADYSGNAASLPEGAFTLNDLSGYSISDNTISSIKVKPGYQVTVYTNDNFSGTSTAYTTNQNGIADFNDNISSIKIEAKGATGLSGVYKIKGRNSGLYMGTPDAQTSNGTMIQQQAGNVTGSNQQFEVKEISNGVYKITGLQSNKLLNVSSNLSTNGVALQIWDNIVDAKNQQFIIIPVENGYYQFVARHSARILEVAGDSRIEGAFIQQYDNNGQTYSHWKFESSPAFGTDITDNGGTISASHTEISSAESVDKVTDNIAITKYCAVANAGESVWLRYQSPKPVILESYSITSANNEQGRDPKAWKLQGSQDGINWSDIDTQTNQTFENRYKNKTYLVSTSTAYQYFRLYVTERYSGTVTAFQVGEWQLFGKEVESAGVENVNTLFNVYPNPVESQLFIHAEEETTVRIYNMLGQMTYERNLAEGTNMIDVADYSNGVYIVRISAGKFSESFSLIKK